MSKEKQIEEMAFTDVDVLANDINEHCADLAENYCGGTSCLACLAHALTAKGYRKQSEGEWITKHRHRGGFRTVTVVDSFGEKHTGTVDDRWECDDLYCSVCGKIAHDAFLNYCANCGAKMNTKDEEQA